VLAASLRDLQLAEPELLEERRGDLLERRAVALAQAPAEHRECGAAELARGGGRARRDWRRHGGPLARLGLRDERHGLAVELEERLPPGGLAAAVVLRERRPERRRLADERVRHEEALRALRRDLRDAERAPRAGEDLVGHLRGRRELPSAPLLLLAAAPAAPLGASGGPRDLARGHRVALAAAIGRLALRRRLDESVEPDGVLVQAPFGERESPRLHGHDAAIRPRQAAMRHELVRHRLLGDLAHVIEQALPDGDLGQLPEVEGLSFAPQHLDRCFREGHLRP
jgi:hypothetical protein